MKIKFIKNIWFKRMFFMIVPLSIILIYKQAILSLIFGYGYVEVYNGNDERGNKIMEHVISITGNPKANLLHAYSVQNTKNGNYDIAISALEKAYKMNPNEMGAYYGWVLLYYYHDYEKSLDILNEYDSLTPDFSDWPMGECIHYLKGLAYMQLGSYEKAIIEFNISIENTSKEHGASWVDYHVYLNKGVCLLHKKEYKKASIEFDKSIMDCDRCPEAYYYKGLSQLKLNLNNEACQNLNEAYSLIKQGYKSSDTYVELFSEIYEQEVEESIKKYCLD